MSTTALAFLQPTLVMRPGMVSQPADSRLRLLTPLHVCFRAVIFRESVYVGETNLSQTEVQQVVARLGQEYKGNRYHLLQRNCNHFATELCFQLVGKHAPAWVSARTAPSAALKHFCTADVLRQIGAMHAPPLLAIVQAM